METRRFSTARLSTVSLILVLGGCTALNSAPLDGGENSGTAGTTAGGGHGGSVGGSGATGKGGVGGGGATGTGGTVASGGVSGEGGNAGQGGAAGASGEGGASGATGTGGAAGKGGSSGKAGTTGTGGTSATGTGGAGGTGAPVCGNGIKEGTEQCDLGTALNTGAYGGCKADCTLAPYCGDGIVNGPEVCDKGTAANTGAYGGCKSDCTLAPYCGDGIVNGSEACDKGTSANTGGYGGCTSTCMLGPYCGDGIVNGTEACDKGTAANTGAYNGCTSTCKLGPYCGDGIVNGTEACDNGGSNGTALNACNPICSGTVGAKHIQVYATTVYPNFGGVAGADTLCQGAFGTTYRAFIVDGSTRIATATALKGDGQVGWILKKYMQYQTAANLVIWTTDTTALLGVNNGVAATLTNPIAPSDDGANAWDGMNPDYTTASDCAGWTSMASTDHGTAVNVAATAVDANFPENGSLSACAYQRHLICVEQ